MIKMWRVGLLLLLTLFTRLVQADALMVTDSPSLSMDPAVQYLEDPQGKHTIETIRNSSTEWQPPSGGAFNQGYSASVWWLKLSLDNTADKQLFRYLELSYAVLDYVDIHVLSGDKTLATYSLGDRYPFAERPVENRFFIIPLELSPGQKIDIYYRIKTSTSVQAPLTLWERDAFERRENASSIAQGLYYGAMVVIAVYNLLIFLALWERSYLYYVMFVLALPLFMASISGQAYRFLWPEAIAWNDHSIPIFLGLAFGSSALFAQRFLRVKQWSVRLHLGLGALAFCAFSCVAISFVAPYYVSIHLLVPLGLFACVFEMVVGGLAWYKKIPNARYYVIAWLAFLFGGVLLALNKLNILPTNFFTEYSLQFGSVLEAVLLSFAMAERINVERKLRFAAQYEALQATRRLNEELEKRVQERTHELEQANQKLEALSNTDQLTQLKNRRYMENALQEEWLRCHRYGHSIAILMMDVDHFKSVNDRYGHPAGDACLRQVAERMNSCIRWPMDQIARYGGEEFCMILPETDAAGAHVVAERIRELIQATPVLTGKEQFQVTMSIGICAMIPCDDLSVETVVRFADIALYQAKQTGRNKVMAYDTGTHDSVPAAGLAR